MLEETLADAFEHAVWGRREYELTADMAIARACRIDMAARQNATLGNTSEWFVSCEEKKCAACVLSCYKRIDIRTRSYVVMLYSHSS